MEKKKNKLGYLDNHPLVKGVRDLHKDTMAEINREVDKAIRKKFDGGGYKAEVKEKNGANKTTRKTSKKDWK